MKIGMICPKILVPDNYIVTDLLEHIQNLTVASSAARRKRAVLDKKKRNSI
jgi:hypothetical protein